MAKKRKKRKKTKHHRKEREKSFSPPVEQNILPKAEEKKKSKSLFVIIFFIFIIIISLSCWYLFFPRKRIKKDPSFNVVLITLDTTRADRLGCYGYGKAKTPNLDYLAANGIRFENVFCQVPLTTPSHCSILTGTYPIYHQVHNNGSYRLPSEIKTLAEILKERGFDTAAFVGSFTVDSRFGLDQGFDLYDDTFVENQAFKALNSERKAEQVYQSFVRWLENREDKQFFCWVHFFDPHLPYDPPPPYRTEFVDDLYDGEIAYMDEYVGKTIDAFRTKNLLHKTLIVVAGDHGEAFGEKTERGHGIFLYNETMKVPLIFYAENHFPPSLTIKSRVRLIDIVPTILDLLKISVPEEIQGVSLVPFMQGKKKKDLTTYIETYFPLENYGWAPLIGLIDGRWKYIKAPKEELYDLKKDSLEENNLIVVHAKIALQQRTKLEKLLSQYSSPLTPTKRNLSSQEIAKLRSLGYVAHSTEIPQGPLPDPKDMLDELQLSQQAESYELEGKFAEAAKVYEKMLSLRPENQTGYVNLALMYARCEQFNEAVKALQRGLILFPQSITLLSRLAHTYLVMGKLQKSLETWASVLEIDPQYFDGLLGTGWILDLMGKKEKALNYYERALNIEPENKFLRKNYARTLGTSGRISEAIRAYEELKKNYPDDYEILEELGIAYGYAGDLNKAIDNLSKSIALHPTPLAYLNLAVAYRKVGNIEKAIENLKLYLANPEEDPKKIARIKQELLFLERQLKK